MGRGKEGYVKRRSRKKALMTNGSGEKRCVSKNKIMKKQTTVKRKG